VSCNHRVTPLARIYELDVKTREIKERASVPSKEGLIMGLQASVLYHLQPERAAEVLQKVGANYADVLLVPSFRSAMRAVTASNTASALYSDSRECPKIPDACQKQRDGTDDGIGGGHGEDQTRRNGGTKDVPLQAQLREPWAGSLRASVSPCEIFSVRSVQLLFSNS